MVDAQFKAKLPKFSRCKTLSIIRCHNLRDREVRKYPLLQILDGRSSRGLSDGNHLYKLRKHNRIAVLSALLRLNLPT